MLIELAEVLDCPDCRASVGLVAFADRMASRRIVEGRLGCPLCEIEVPIRQGTMRFDRSNAVRRATSDPEAAGRLPAESVAVAPPTGSAGEAAEEAALRLAALLGVHDRAGMVVLLGPRLALHGSAVARIGGRLEVLAWLPDPADAPASAAPGIEDLAAGVNPVLGAAPDRWPVRTGALHGIALTAPMAFPMGEIARCARPGARLVVEAPTRADLDLLGASQFAEVASDPAVWVGQA